MAPKPTPRRWRANIFADCHTIDSHIQKQGWEAISELGTGFVESRSVFARAVPLSHTICSGFIFASIWTRLVCVELDMKRLPPEMRPIAGPNRCIFSHRRRAPQEYVASWPAVATCDCRTLCTAHRKESSRTITLND